MKIYVVRHGQTDYNKDGIMQGQNINAQINESGINQVNVLKMKLKDIKFNVCYTSPLIRAWSTAMILVGDKVEIKEDKRLIERYLGELEGKNRKEYDVKKYWDYNLNSNDSDVETVRELFDRCNSFIDYLKSNYNKDDNILIVTHNAIVRTMYHILNNSDLNSNLLTFKIDNASCFEFDL